MAILRLYTGEDGKSHFEEIEPAFQQVGDRSDQAIIHAEPFGVTQQKGG